MLERYYKHKDLVTQERVRLVHDVYQRNYEYSNAKSKAVAYSVERYNQNLSYKGKHISAWGGQLKIPLLLMWSEPGSQNRVGAGAHGAGARQRDAYPAVVGAPPADRSERALGDDRHGLAPERPCLARPTDPSDPAPRAKTREEDAMNSPARFGLALALMASAFVLQLTTFAQPPDTTVVRARRIYTVTKGVIENGEILIAGGKIQAIGPKVDAPATARSYTAEVVIPGMIDAHSHMALDRITLGYRRPNHLGVEGQGSLRSEEPDDSGRALGRRHEHHHAVGERHHQQRPVGRDQAEERPEPRT